MLTPASAHRLSGAPRWQERAGSLLRTSRRKRRNRPARTDAEQADRGLAADGEDAHGKTPSTTVAEFVIVTVELFLVLGPVACLCEVADHPIRRGPAGSPWRTQSVGTLTTLIKWPLSGEVRSPPDQVLSIVSQTPDFAATSRRLYGAPCTAQSAARISAAQNQVLKPLFGSETRIALVPLNSQLVQD